MKKILKKLGVGLLTAMFVAGTGLTLAGCSKDPENQVISLSVNPGVEFIVDNNDKVLSVTANNEDGAYILEKYQSFTGMSAKDAALKFLELSEEYGFVVEGTTDGEKFTISVSGEGATDLYNDVKNKISSKVEELGLTIEAMDKITEEELQEIVAQCYQDYSESEIEALTQEELTELIKNSREETKDLATEEERLNYYKERALKIVETKINTIESYIDENLSLVEKMKVEATVVLLNEAHNMLQTLYDLVDTQLEALDSLIEPQLEAYISQKQAYLQEVKEYREALALNLDADPNNDVENIEELKESLMELKSEADLVKEQIESKRQEVKEEISNILKTTINQSLQTVNEYIDTVLTKIDLGISEINEQVKNQLTILKNEHEQNSTSLWGNEQ